MYVYKSVNNIKLNSIAVFCLMHQILNLYIKNNNNTLTHKQKINITFL